MHSSVAMITLLTTSISRSGKPLRAPMPRLGMRSASREDIICHADRKASPSDAYAVIGPQIPRFEDELGDTSGFADRIQLIEERLIRMLDSRGTLDLSLSQQTACLRATAFIASRQWPRIPGCHQDNSRDVS